MFLILLKDKSISFNLKNFTLDKISKAQSVNPFFLNINFSSFPVISSLYLLLNSHLALFPNFIVLSNSLNILSNSSGFLDFSALMDFDKTSTFKR